MIERRISDEERAKLERAVSGEGGWQNFRSKIQSQIQDNTLTLYPGDLETAERYAQGEGGHQNFCRLVLEIAARQA